MTKVTHKLCTFALSPSPSVCVYIIVNCSKNFSHNKAKQCESKCALYYCVYGSRYACALCVRMDVYMSASVREHVKQMNE